MMGQLRTDIDAAAVRVEHAVQDLVDFVQRCSETQWRLTTQEERWTVAATARHAADGFAAADDWIQRFRAGLDVPGSPDTHDMANADHAVTYARVHQRQVIELVRRNGVALAATIRRLSSEDLVKSGAHGPAGGVTLSIDDVLGDTGRHTERHLASAREAVNSHP